jgi:hypothetical protein
MGKGLPVPLDGRAREQYLNRLKTRMEFLHDFVSGKEDGWGVEEKELKSVVEHLSRAWSVVAAAKIKLVFDRGEPRPDHREPAPRSGNVIPFPPRLVP